MGGIYTNHQAQSPMKDRILLLHLLMLTACCLVACSSRTKPFPGEQSADSIPRTLIPQPVSVAWKPGVFVINADTILCSAPEFVAIANAMARQFRRATGFPLEVVSPGTANAANAIYLLMDRSLEAQGDEAYRIEVMPRQIRLSAPRRPGAFYACQTLRQLLPHAIEETRPSEAVAWNVPCVDIVDSPRFSWRGYMLDSARHFQTPDEIKRLMDLLALHKINRLHWHLIDDQGWRLPVPAYPELIRQAAFRPNANAFLNYRPKESPDNYGGYYSHEEIRALVAYAQERNITVVPEIEMPGHTLAALVAYPELSCRGTRPGELGETWIYKDVYCAGNDDTFVFLEAVLDVVLDLFPSSWIHVGGDEVPKDRWQECPKCRERIRKEGLRNEAELQGYFMRRIESYLQKHDRILIGWDDIMEGGLSPSAMMQTYREPRYGIEAAQRGNRVIFSTHLYVYFDYSHEATPVEKTYSFDPVTEDLAPETARNIVGIEGCQWLGNVSRRHLEATGEIMPARMIEHNSFPRLLALAEIAWSPKEARNWGDFRERLREYRHRLDLLEVHYYPDPALVPPAAPTPTACRLSPSQPIPQVSEQTPTDPEETNPLPPPSPNGGADRAPHALTHTPPTRNRPDTDSRHEGLRINLLL